ncbi:hypothetical protein [Streptomyces sp. NBC_01306]|uniref:hypothetical protein n=1 Tax=Streptomyces sp. NBC_01306 TaxID=2903819 RepID=UPI002253C345|nr:hypothetical protein [Streptomyces sp. NBC_01306]MCX4724789.1 hypothetical protein [Streptomyces sp. NBC_01306]
MNANQQHMLDAYRAAQRGETAPPLPGRHDWEAIGEIRDHLSTGRPGARRTEKRATEKRATEKRARGKARTHWLSRNGRLRRLLTPARTTNGQHTSDPR